ncbi:MAG: sporulation regulator WhiA, partial [Clostridia bacterium]|nr:sporulation regulator WhiA [Clostridia bacterium]
DSLKELGEKTDPPIGKSGVNHRLNRIIEMADNL